jgi:hypothetical protein
MVSAIASRKYERAALSRLFWFTLAIQPTVQANTEVTAEVTMWPTNCLDHITSFCYKGTSYSLS